MRQFHLHPAPDNAALAVLAMRRYPDENPLLAIDFLLSDRREAGLGALDGRKRRASRPHSPVRNLKEFDLLSGRLIYSRTIHILAHHKAPTLDYFEDYLMAYGPQDETYTVTTVPERRVAMAVRIERPPETQADRDMAAAALRELRRSTRA